MAPIDPLMTVVGIAVFAIAALVMLYVLFKIIGRATNIFKTLMINSLIGLIAALILSLFGIQFPLTVGTICAVALFGIPAVGTILILMFSGMI